MSKLKIYGKFVVAFSISFFAVNSLFLQINSNETLAMFENESSLVLFTNGKSNGRKNLILICDDKGKVILKYGLSEQDVCFFKRIFAGFKNGLENFAWFKEEAFVSKVTDLILKNAGVGDKINDKNQAETLLIRKNLLSRCLKNNCTLKFYDDQGDCICNLKMKDHGRIIEKKISFSEEEKLLNSPKFVNLGNINFSDNLAVNFRNQKNNFNKTNKNSYIKTNKNGKVESVVKSYFKEDIQFFKRYCQLNDEATDFILHFCDTGNSKINQSAYLIFSPTYFKQKFGLPAYDPYFYNICYEIVDENGHKYFESSMKAQNDFNKPHFPFSGGIHVKSRGDCAYANVTIYKNGKTPYSVEEPFLHMDSKFRFENGKNYVVRFFKNNSFDECNLIAESCVKAKHDVNNLFSRLGEHTYFYKEFKHPEEFDEAYYCGECEFFKNLRFK